MEKRVVWMRIACLVVLAGLICFALVRVFIGGGQDHVDTLSAPTPLPTPVIQDATPSPTPPNVNVTPGLPTPSNTPEPLVTPSAGAPTPNFSITVAGALPEREPVPISYFDGAIFLGDSVAEGLFSYGRLDSSRVKYAAANSIGVYDIDEKKYVNPTGTSMTFDEAMQSQREGVTVVYLAFGMNDVGKRISPENFIAKYNVLLGRVRENFPDQPIYICGITPMTREVSESQEGYNRDYEQTTTNAFNAALGAWCQQTPGLYFVASHEIFRDADGFMMADIAKEDGFHFKKEYYDWWVNYLRTHTIEQV